MSAQQAVDPLAALEDRFGPSDEDREAWLAARRQGLTATEVRDLYIGATTIDRLAAEKLGRRRVAHAGNRYTAWGSAREPIIAAAVQERYGIKPESRVVRDAGDPRRLASPDGIGAYGFTSLCVSEIKTSGEPIPYGSEAFEKKGYLAQIVWTMLRVGAIGCLYAWELREDDGAGGFVPGELHFEWILLVDHVDLAAYLEGLGTRFLARMDELALEPFEEGEFDENLDTLAVNVLAARVTEGEGKAAKEAAWSELLRLLAERGTDFQQESTLARITYTAEKATPSTERVVDVEEAIRQAPALHSAVERAREELATVEAVWAEHLKNFTTEKPSTTTTKANLTVTAVKQKGITG